MNTGQTIRSAPIMGMTVLVSYFSIFLRTAISVFVSVLQVPPPTNILSLEIRQIEFLKEKKSISKLNELNITKLLHNSIWTWLM